MTVTPIIHVPEIEPVLDFYCETLGFEAVFTQSDERMGKLMHAELKLEDGTLLIGLLPDDGGTTDALGDGVELYFTTSQDIDAYYDRVSASDALAVEEPGDRYWGARTFSISDPCGYWLTFASPPKRS